MISIKRLVHYPLVNSLSVAPLAGPQEPLLVCCLTHTPFSPIPHHLCLSPSVGFHGWQDLAVRGSQQASKESRPDHGIRKRFINLSISGHCPRENNQEAQNIQPGFARLREGMQFFKNYPPRRNRKYEVGTSIEKVWESLRIFRQIDRWKHISPKAVSKTGGGDCFFKYEDISGNSKNTENQRNMTQ